MGGMNFVNLQFRSCSGSALRGDSDSARSRQMAACVYGPSTNQGSVFDHDVLIEKIGYWAGVIRYDDQDIAHGRPYHAVGDRKVSMVLIE